MNKADTVLIGGMEFQFLANRGVYWPERGILFVADTHFGKEATFRKHGIPVPRGSTHGTLSSIAFMLANCSANRLVLLGDMFHARSSLSEDILDSLDAFFADHSELQFTLVPGNHDRHLGKLPVRWKVETVAPGHLLGQVAIAHSPADLPSGECQVMLCGHIHPAVRFQSRTETLGKLPCFWLTDGKLVLPAIGKFTGTHEVRPNPKDRMWAIIEKQIIEV